MSRSSGPPTTEFPCAYPIRVIGHNHSGFRARVLAIVRSHAPDLEETSVRVRDSREGGYRSIYFSIEATGEAQLKALHAELMADPSVKLVL